MVELTKAQRRVLVKLKASWWEEGKQPVLSELAADLGMHYVSLKQHLEALDRKGYLTFEAKGRGKAPVLVLHGQDDRGVPLVGAIAAGELWSTEEHLEGFIKVPGREGRFALRVTGDSMSERIGDGDVVILEPGQPRGGEICAVRFEDETTLKYLDLYQNGSALLRPHNPGYPPIDVNLSDIHVAGLYVGHVSGSIAKELFSEAA